ncbi:DUF1697 domain-containing protein [Arthrobacter sp. NIO-1057]|uniref:DUF1697 domain-containing protein n=1 Tax=Arthrobacter sp. NIO-1057 TaxID=993071 RepID=UPI000AD927D0|nr:DUF1697 domain-containing protein [Arthrobacter sp. NIO-1057]
MFLRGVNVGGIKVLMKDLTSLLQDGGFQDVKTLLASGNVVLNSEASDPLVVQDGCNELLRQYYQREIPTLVFTEDEIQELAQPFVLPIPEPASDHHAYLTLCNSVFDAHELGEAIGRLDAQRYDYVIVGRTVQWIASKGTSTTDPVAKVIQAQAKHRILTTRNHNTLIKVAKIFR